MGTQDDPIRALAERGILHVDMLPPQNTRKYGKDLRPGQTAPATSDLAKAWDSATDSQIYQHKPEALLRKQYDRDRMPEVLLEHNPWLAKVPPDTLVNISKLSQTRSGFEHLIDELRNAMNPASGLPAHLQLKPEKLANVSVPQAVEHVAKINAWRLANRAETDKLAATNAATFLHKDYPEQGLSWQQLRLPKDTADQTSLPAALTYEGDIMKNCVGGYCKDVVAGKRKIFSLRDAKGEPHVTIEVKPASNGVHSIVQIKGKTNKAPAAKYLPAVQDFIRSQEWLRVGELDNAGLMSLSSLKTTGVKPADIALLSKVLPKYFTPDELKVAIEALNTPPNAFNK